MKFNSFKTLKTRCGKEFNKDLLKVIAFTTSNFKYSHSTYTVYKTQLDGYIRCLNTYDAINDCITIDCEFISEKEALVYIGKTQRYN